jgi:hypothetical protein
MMNNSDNDNYDDKNNNLSRLYPIELKFYKFCVAKVYLLNLMVGVEKNSYTKIDNTLND